ncbi:MAG: hypothetical protein ACKPEO_09430, partial [Sphaerospermopsis kisseleviana]
MQNIGITLISPLTFVFRCIKLLNYSQLLENVIQDFSILEYNIISALVTAISITIIVSPDAANLFFSLFHSDYDLAKKFSNLLLTPD